MEHTTRTTARDALLIAALGCATATHANTLQIVDETSNGLTTHSARAIYAKETLDGRATQPPSDERDHTRYYVIEDILTLTAPARVGAHRQDAWRVHYELENMVFANAVEHTPRLASRLVAGGLAGDAYALFKSHGEVLPGEHLRLRAQFAIAADNADTGSVRRSTENTRLRKAGDAGATQTIEGTDIIVLRAALVEQIEAPRAPPLADTASGYATFEPRAGAEPLATAIARVRIGVVRPALRNARADGERVETLSDLTDDKHVGIPAGIGGGAPHGNTLHIEGDLSFASWIGFAPATGIGPGTACARTIKALSPDEREPWARTAPIPIDERWERPQWLCLKAGGKRAIPSTRPYRLVTSYGRIASAPFGPESASHTIARIEREGTSYPIATLKGGAGWAQRITVTNRAEPAKYAFIEWQTDSLEPAWPGKRAQGTFAHGINTVDIRDILDIEHWANASVTLAIDADPHALSATLERRNHSDQGIESIVLEPEQNAY